MPITKRTITIELSIEELDVLNVAVSRLHDDRAPHKQPELVVIREARDKIRYHRLILQKINDRYRS